MLELITGIGFVLFIEGALYALFPLKVQQFMRSLAEGDPAGVRVVGVLALVSGFLILWWTRS